MLLSKFSLKALMAAAAIAVLTHAASAQGVLSVKDLSLGLAQAISQALSTSAARTDSALPSRS